MEIQLDPSLKFLQPLNLPKNEFVRLGSNIDGGYVIPKVALQKSTALLSLGLGDNWSFEEHWANIKPNDLIYVYDGAIDYNNWAPVHHELYRQFFGYRATHIAHNVSRMSGDWSFNQAVDPLLNSQIFAKIDIEGCEYQLIEELLDLSDSITGMAIEFHGANHRENFTNAIQELQAKFTIVHLHGNNCSPLSYYQLPDTLEISFINHKLSTVTEKRTDVYLPGLDFPNNSDIEDYILHF